MKLARITFTIFFLLIISHASEARNRFFIHLGPVLSFDSIKETLIYDTHPIYGFNGSLGYELNPTWQLGVDFDYVDHYYTLPLSKYFDIALYTIKLKCLIDFQGFFKRHQLRPYIISGIGGMHTMAPEKKYHYSWNYAGDYSFAAKFGAGAQYYFLRYYFFDFHANYAIGLGHNDYFRYPLYSIGFGLFF